MSRASFFESLLILPEVIISSMSNSLLTDPLIVFQFVRVPPNQRLSMYGKPKADASSLIVFAADLFVPTNRILFPLEHISSALDAAALRCS